jgi:hypothetical protein
MPEALLQIIVIGIIDIGIRARPVIASFAHELAETRLHSLSIICVE